MQSLTLAMIVVVTTFEFLVRGDDWGRWAVLPSVAKYVPELLSLVAVLVVVFAGTRNRFQYVRPQYWLVFGALVLTIVCGILANSVDAGPILAGTRTYLRAIPWFLIPAVYAFTNDEVRTQLRLVAVIALLQAPLAIQQRLSTAAQGSTTGDMTSGTLLISSVMSIFLICVTAIAAAMLVRKKLNVRQFALLAVLLLLPTTINETKGTLVLVPLALSLAFLAASAPGRRLKAIVTASSLLVVFGLVFFPVYDYYGMQRTYAVPLSEFLSDPERVQGYLWKQEEIGTTGAAGRVDSIIVPLQRLSKDPITLTFGYGMGNASDSSLGHGFVGEHFDVLSPFLVIGFSRMLLELGLLGTLLVFTLIWLVYQDSKAVARQRDDVVGALAAGWVSVTVVMGVCIFYKDLIIHTSISYLFWYFSGLVAAMRMRPVHSN